MIYGEYNFKIDGHGRVQIPSEARESFEDSNICLVRTIYGKNYFGFIKSKTKITIHPPLSREEEEKLLELDPKDKRREDYFSGQPRKIDTQKRVVLDLKFRGLEATLRGRGDHLLVEI